MTLGDFQNYCKSFKGVSFDFPFDDITMVVKVGGKMFALTNFNEFKTINVKCDPEEALILRQIYKEVIPGYHMNKKHWNTIEINRGVGDDQIKKWISDSYNLVFKKLTKKERALISCEK